MNTQVPKLSDVEKCNLLYDNLKRRAADRVGNIIHGGSRDAEEVSRETVNDFLIGLEILKEVESRYAECVQAIGFTETKFAEPDTARYFSLRGQVLELVRSQSYRIYDSDANRSKVTLKAKFEELVSDPEQKEILRRFSGAMMHWANIYQLSRQIQEEERAILKLV